MLINISYDTKEKTCSITMNGQTLDNVSNVYIEKYIYDGKEESHIEISIHEKMEDESMSKVTRLYASKKKENVLSIDELETYAAEKFEKIKQAAYRWLSRTEK